ncbi:Ctr copper transporter [Aspergillus karnatakaensis]|uniref:copper transporter family protein n=1 Tax=Aspergillus karnatakaensis TaxID=1810916 RepID=UPI003CCD791D
MSHSHTGHSSDSSSGSTMTMAMVFTNAHDTPLFSSQWTPTTSGSYAGTCIFLIILAVISRLLVACKTYLEQRWLNAHLKRRYIVVAGKPSEAGRIAADPDCKTGTLVTARGVEESVRVVTRDNAEVVPWRFSVDLPRGAAFLVIAGVNYLLMLGVMTMNVGYFCSVLGGLFLGEVAVGRYVVWAEAHGH